MSKYELLITLPGTLNDKESSARSEEVADLVREYDPAVELHSLGKIRLAYPIKQIRYGYFYTLIFNTEPGQAAILQEKLRLNREILRFMVSHFNTSLTASQKIVYNTDGMGVATMREKAEETAPRPRPESAKALNLEEIDKKLDEILDGSIIT